MKEMKMFKMILEVGGLLSKSFTEELEGVMENYFSKKTFPHEETLECDYCGQPNFKFHQVGMQYFLYLTSLACNL